MVQGTHYPIVIPTRPGHQNPQTSEVQRPHRWPEIYAGPWIVTGNVAKLKVLHEIHRLISSGSEPCILDVGCVGPKPLEFWEPVLCNRAFRFDLTAMDTWGIDKARELAEQRGWMDRVILREGSGYNLEDMFPPRVFDLVIATQVLEHVARLSTFMRQIAAVLKYGGEAFFTADSAHWRPRFDPSYPVRLMKNLVKKGLSSFGNEKHYDLPWFDHEVIGECERAGLKVIECRYYNLAPLKFLHNHLIPRARRNEFMRLWFELEELVNEEQAVREKAKLLFMGFYLHVRKV